MENRSFQKRQPWKKESILDFSKYYDLNVRVKFVGGRELQGILKGYDPMVNLVLDQATEFVRDPDDPYKVTEDTRELGLVVCRGPAVALVCPVEGSQEIENPFFQRKGEPVMDGGQQDTQEDAV